MNKDKQQVAKEKDKAKKMRKSRWWQQQIVDGICHYCQKKFEASELTMDHVVPLSRGGKSTKGNIVPCCKQCNSDKKYYTPVDMILKKLEDEKKEKNNAQS